MKSERETTESSRLESSSSETDAYYYRARYYDASPGRFLTEDPVGFLSGGINFYEYVENSPLSFTDPNGLQAQPGGACCDDKKLKRGIKQVQDAFANAAATKSAIFQKYAKCLQKLANDPDVKCGPPPKNQPTACGYHSPLSPSTTFITPNGSTGQGGCGPTKGTIAHEMVHSCIQNDLAQPPMNTIDEEKQAYGIECQLWGLACNCARDPKKCGY
ncbi:MAG TPA: RHS repeat-associated core domain-containing protein [Candidatus Sulfotelmatobacter sp.]|jgi:RHS repeat-associated protein|nr:RHS repeat-associated core domain-containing protein [Candidatus Sulfotelmatobacter sp.]